jgi:hypothetical protein
MNRIFYALMVVCTLASCADSYSVQGSSSVSALDGSKLYLKSIKNNELKNIDSCEVVHGQFRFAGLLDTVRMANLFMDDESIMPVVLEEGEITILIDRAKQSVTGTALNDSLYHFIDKHNQLDNRFNELEHKQNQMILEGIDETQIVQEVQAEAQQIAEEREQLMTNSIIENFDNALGPYLFEMLTSVYRYPILTPQIEYIMSKATKKFKRDPYVNDYYTTAQENEKRMQGFDIDGTPAPAASSPVDTTAKAPVVNVPQE